MAAPIQPASLSDVDLVLCTHRHTDHMDPETLRAIASANHDCVFVVPQAWREHAIGFGLPGDRVLGADAALSLEPLPGLVVTPVLAAHEGLEFDEFGHSRHLGYVLGSEGIRVYHSGDCVPFANQADQLRGLGIQIALLPVNGRDADRLAHGVPGNFHPAEAIALAAAIGAQTILGHHFGMFAFNTVHEPHLADALRDLPDALQWVRPQLSRPYWIVHA
jgi:L-ascorbate metabolism protein UlaG (beta-lactamase superfamily)